MATRAPSPIVEISKAIWNSNIFTEIGANQTKAKPFHLLINNKTPIATSEKPIRGIMYPVWINASIKLPIGGASIEINPKNLLLPKINKIMARRIRSTIDIRRFINNRFSL